MAGLPAGALKAQCPNGTNHLRLELKPDQYFNEISWSVTDLSGANVFYTGACSNTDTVIYDYCVPQGNCSVFRIVDSYGDGLLPNGYYTLSLNGQPFYDNIGGDYQTGENVRFGCPPGAFCDDPYLMTLGEGATPHGGENWYSFTPDSNGIYEISTCDSLNPCLSKIWVYDACGSLEPAENQTAALFYAYGGCDYGAVATMYLAKDKQYFIRLRYTLGDCLNDIIRYNLRYVGPISGCTDPNACNYDPLATVSDTCLYDGDPECPNAPDLMFVEQDLRNSLSMELLLNNDACYVAEGCLRGTGNRYIIRFTTHIRNIGTQDYYIGETPVSPDTPSDQFVWDPCHNHWHYRGYAEYILFDEIGTQIPIGSKNGFCVLDLTCPPGINGQYSCGNMGITAGCGDIYDAQLPCQWIDINGLSAGKYTLVARVNWDKSPDRLGRYEKTYDNNWAQACFELRYDVLGNPSMEPFENDCEPFTDCLGEIYGNARPDCQGDCNGVALFGDMTQDTLRDIADTDAYLDAALAEADPTTCTDLFQDAKIDVFDAALLQECHLHENDPSYWGLRFPCMFPAGIVNNEDIMYLLPGAIDEQNKTFDIMVVNPYGKIMGYEFAVNGLVIDSIENLGGGFEGDIRFEPDGHIIGLSLNEKPVKKNILPGGLLRIHYASLSAQEVCIGEVTAFVNERYQKMAVEVAEPSCVQTNFVGTREPAAVGVSIIPNPAKETTTLFFENREARVYNFELRDATGRLVRHFEQLRGESITIDRAGLPDGVYIFRLSGFTNKLSGKIIFN